MTFHVQHYWGYKTNNSLGPTVEEQNYLVKEMLESGMPKKNLGISNPQQGMKRFYTDVSSTSIILSSLFGFSSAQ